MAESKEAPEERRYRDAKKPAAAEGEVKEEATESPAEKEAEHEGSGAEVEMHTNRLMQLAKTHERERRDLHGQHREQMRQMHARHEASLREAYAGMGNAGGGVPDGAEATANG